MDGSPVILITGASSGIGAATARLFARQGYRVVLAARRLQRLQELEAEIRAHGGEALAVQADVSRLPQVQSLAQAALERYGQVDVLFNNAGFGRLDWLENLDAIQDVQDQIQVNLLGLIWMTQVVLPHMITRRSGVIINMASVAGLVAPPTYTVYAATKFAVRGFSEALRREVGIYGIRVCGIYPGAVATEFDQHAHIRRKSGVTTPSSMRLSAEDVAQAVWSLARRPRRTLIIPWFLRPAAWLNDLAPGLVDWAVRKLFVESERL